MPCYKPLWAWRSPHTGALIWKQSPRSMSWEKLEIPCSQCIGCRLEKSRQWAMRCMHEASLYEENVFITLTYDDEYLPSDRSLDVTHWQKFMKRLKKSYGGKKIRFYMCGEYGDETQRPHYHALLFGHDFEDKKFYKFSKSGERLYTTDRLERIWGKGYCPIGNVSFESAAYVARYALKKITGERAGAHYEGRIPEFSTMSRNKGIGEPWLRKWHTDVYPHDFVIVNGKRVKPPKFYDDMLSHRYISDIKDNRKERAEEHAENNTDERLAVREEIQQRKQAQIVRTEQ
ncbi:replication initiator protein [Microviridae sp.]|nr:replication initiator protein [Microviridae sp.]